MTLSELARRFEKLVVNNSPAILTAVGVTGALTTAYLTGKATFKAAHILGWENSYRDDVSKARTETFGPSTIAPYIEPKEKVKLVWKFYIPAATSAALTITAIICANRIGTRRAAALAAAFSVTEKAFEEYKDKIVERIGPKKEQAIRDEIAQEHVSRNPPNSCEVYITGAGEILCYDAFSGRYFLSDMETLRKAQNDLNQRMIHDMYCSLSEFYNLIGLKPTKSSEEVGWTSDRLLELKFSAVIAEDGRPCMSVDFDVAPVRNYHRIG